MDAQEYLTDIKAKFPEVTDVPAEKLKDGLPALNCPAASLFEIVKHLKEKGLDFLMNLCATDYKEYFEVIYHLHSLENKVKLVLKVKLPKEKPEVASIMSLHPGADWQEREAFDLLGIGFPGHSNLKRILLPEEWEGYPLRKDYDRKPDQYD
ncbi:MAG: NADH-quinone oxidoreductase subunit C [Candidatus Firestonebacteria bacterium]